MHARATKDSGQTSVIDHRTRRSAEATPRLSDETGVAAQRRRLQEVGDERGAAVRLRQLQEVASRRGTRPAVAQLANGGGDENTTGRVVAGLGIGAYSMFVQRMVGQPAYQRSFVGVIKNLSAIRNAPRPVQIAAVVSTAAMIGLGKLIGAPGALAQLFGTKE